MDFDHRQFVKKAYVGLADIADLQGDPARAVENYERGLDFCDRAADRSEIRQLIADLHILQSRYADAAAAARQATQELARDPRKSGADYYRELAGVSEVKSRILRFTGDTRGALREAKAALRILAPFCRGEDTLSQRSKILNTIAGIYYQRDDPRCLRYYHRALKIEQRLGHLRGVGTLKNNLGNAYSSLGNYKKAAALNLEYLRISERIGDLDGIGTAADSAGCLYYVLNDHRRAIEYLLRSYRISERIGSDFGISYTSNNLGNVYLGIGETKKALEFFRRDLRIARRHGTKRNEGRALYNIGGARLKLREYKKTRQALEPAIKILARVGDRVRLQNALHRLAVARAADERGRRRALMLLGRAYRLSRKSGPRLEVAAVHASHGKVMGFMKDPARVKFHFERAREIFRQGGHRRLEADTLLDYARALMSLPRDRRPAGNFIIGLIRRARAIYSRLRIDRKREEAEKLMTRA